MPHCKCTKTEHTPKMIVVTGGPGAGKTAVLELAKHRFCEHVSVLPEAASIVFGGGFPRNSDPIVRKAAQRAILKVQLELERIVLDEKKYAIALCDRGTLDGIAYWPGSKENFLKENQIDLSKELAKYSAVIHLRVPPVGYNHANPLRVESLQEAFRIDDLLMKIWSEHPHRFVVESDDNFLSKAADALAVIKELLPDCCK